MKRYEYKAVYRIYQADELGAEGWRIVGIEQPYVNSDGESIGGCYIMERELPTVQHTDTNDGATLTALSSAVDLWDGTVGQA